MALTNNSVILIICFLLIVITIVPGGNIVLIRAVVIFLNLLIVISVLQNNKHDGKTDQKKEEKRERVKLDHFNMLQLFTGGSKISDRFHIFSMDEVAILTENYHPSRQLDDADTYRGSLLGDEVIVKRGFNVSKKNLQNFLMVARILYEERHRNIVRVLGGCFECCCPSIVFENVGTPMEIKLPSMSWPKRLQLLKDIATGLLYLWARDIFHGDLTPSKIFLDDYDEAKIAMFDFSLFLEQVCCYSDPTKKEYGTTCDVYSFGIIVCELVTRLSPKSSSPAQYKEISNMSDEEFILHIDDRAGSAERFVRPLKRLLRFAIQCIRTERHLRPTVVEIVGNVEWVAFEMEPLPSALDFC